LGATVIAAASSETKVQAALAAGADAGVCYAGESWREDLREVLDDRDLNMVYDPVGGDVAEPALRSLAPGGRLMVVGFASGTIPRIPLNLALLKRCSIIGVDWGGESRADPAMTPPLLKTLLTWVDEGRLIPAPVSVRPLDDAPMALTDQLNGRLVGKLVLTAD
jgi:NADPH2:quinone reductase